VIEGSRIRGFSSVDAELGRIGPLAVWDGDIDSKGLARGGGRGAGP
jgi:hypothetical protein